MKLNTENGTISPLISIQTLGLTSKHSKKFPTPKYPLVFFSCGNLSGGGKNGMGSRGANNASKFGGRYCVISLIHRSNYD